jgi:hypothetical protein
MLIKITPVKVIAPTARTAKGLERREAIPPYGPPKLIAKALKPV